MGFSVSTVVPLTVLFLIGSVRTVKSFSTAADNNVSHLPASRRLGNNVVNCNVDGVMDTYFKYPPATACDRGMNVINSAGIMTEGMFSLSTFVLLVTKLVPGFSTLLEAVPRYMLNKTMTSMFTNVTVANVGLLMDRNVSAEGAAITKLSVTVNVNMSLDGKYLGRVASAVCSKLKVAVKLRGFRSVVGGAFTSSPIMLTAVFTIVLGLILPGSPGPRTGWGRASL